MYGLLGKKLIHSYSPLIHSLFADYEYKLFERDETELGEFVKEKSVEGFNVTIPYKKSIIKYLDEIDISAEKVGSVNTVKRQADGSLKGYNTDYFGFLTLVKRSGVSFSDRKVLILGSGGASLAVKAVAEDLGAGEIIFISRTGKDNYQNLDKHYDADIIINTTPVGMYPDNLSSPLSLEGFKDLKAVFDIIYNPARTKLILEAEESGIPAFSGLTMLVEQARKASEIFSGKKISEKKSEEVLKKVDSLMKNILLIGMPGCGKSTAGRILAEKLSREFTDTDNEIVARAGIEIPEIFKAQGEKGFRQQETQVLKDICAGSGKVIASGGGIVTVDENYLICRQNCFIVFINRATENLPTDGRPLSQSVGKEELYKKRLPLYRRFCDFEVDGNADINTVVKRITEALK